MVEVYALMEYTLFFLYKQHFINNASFRFNEILSNWLLSNRPASFYVNKQY